MNLRKILIASLMVIVLASALAYYYWQSMMEAGAPQAPHEYNPGYSLHFTDAQILDYGSTPGYSSVYLLFAVNSSDVSEITLQAKQYPQPVPNDIYVLEHPWAGQNDVDRDGFYADLEQALRGRGLLREDQLLNTIQIPQLARFTNSTQKAIIIVPTGRMPSEFFDDSSMASIGRLLGLGCVVVYVGSDFGQTIGRDETITNQDPAALAAKFNISYAPVGSSQPAIPPYRLRQSTFMLAGLNSSFKYNSLSWQKIGSGYLIVFPNTLEVGWGDWHTGPALAAGDVAELLYRVEWEQPTATANKTVSLAQPDGSATDSLFINGVPAQSAGNYIRVYESATMWSGPGENRTVNSFTEISGVRRTVSGHMLNPFRGVNGSSINVALQISGSSGGQTLYFNLVAHKDGRQVQEQPFISAKYSDGFESTKQYVVNLTDGDYILRLADPSGTVYAQSYLHVPVATVEKISMDYDTPRFAFRLATDGVPVTDTPVMVSIDGGPPMAATTDASGAFAVAPASSPGVGNHTFAFNTTGRMLTLSDARSRPTTFFDDTKNQVIIGATLIIFILGIALQRSEPERYFIDVPDFPPQRKERVMISKYSLINLLDSMNADYRWKYMPLTIGEIKTGVKRKIKYQGKPVLISDYNLDKLLSKLAETGQVFKEGGAYGLASWLKQSGKTPRYLAMFREMRNFFINNAILFTEVGQRQDADVLANYRGENIFVHIYEGDESIARASRTAAKGMTYVVFASREELDEFERRLATSATSLAVTIKMESDIGRIQFITLGTLNAIIGRAS
ncbi:MAG: hypothetical protein PHF51_01005 [Candidatus ainarchaeum sp.]|nr:hypothetical protein [Candidatus ainarchaeum sp.]